MDEFTGEEKRLLSPFVSNLDRPVFALRNLPETVMGALFSRYSRTTKSLRRVLLDEFMLDPESGFREIVGFDKEKGTEQLIAVKKAEEFYDRVLVGYGDDSVAELGGAHLAVEEVSNIATKVLQDSRIGLSPLEKSTRYVYFHEKKDGKYTYLREPALMQSRHADTFIETCDLLFDTYSRSIDPLSKYLAEKYPREKEASDRAYAASLRAKTCDLLRGLLPAATLTNTGLYGNGRAFEYLLLKMYASPLQEIHAVASSMQGELAKVIPAFVKRADDAHGRATQEFLKDTARQLGKLAAGVGEGEPAGEEKGAIEKEVTLVDFDPQAEEKIAAAALYAHAHLPLSELRKRVRKLPLEKRREIIEAAWQLRQNRRQKPGRSFENAHYTFDILANFGAYRDLQRHRVLTQERQLLSTRHGYDFPQELQEAGVNREFHEGMKTAAETFESIAKEMPQEAQYVVPLAYRIRWYATLNAREAIHLIELRSMPQGHPDYRRVVQKMYAEIRQAQPALAAAMKFVHLEGVGLERLEAEKRLDKKAEELKRKYGK